METTAKAKRIGCDKMAKIIDVRINTITVNNAKGKIIKTYNISVKIEEKYNFHFWHNDIYDIAKLVNISTDIRDLLKEKYNADLRYNFKEINSAYKFIEVYIEPAIIAHKFIK